MINIFMGSGVFSRELFDLLCDGGFEIRAVVTGPEQRAGRGLHSRPTAVKTAAEKRDIEVLELRDLKGEENLASLRSWQPDLILVADYGIILPREVLEIPDKGCINAHPSLLPQYRGAAPIQRALMDGAKKTGVTLILLDTGMDTGPIISQAELEIGVEEDLASLGERLARLAAEMIMETLPRFFRGEIEPRPQEGRATFASAIEKSDLVIDWSRDAYEIRNRIRALSPSPGAFSCFRGKRIKILGGGADSESFEVKPGGIAKVEKGSLGVACGSGLFFIQELQPEGKKAMSVAEFIRGYRPGLGEMFEEPQP